MNFGDALSKIFGKTKPSAPINHEAAASNKYFLGSTSRKRLEGVHPDLVAVVERALELSDVDFTVLDGVRTIERQIRLYAQGRTTKQMIQAGIYDTPGKPDEKIVTWTLNSQHFVNKATGYGHAVDLAPWIGGKVDWTWKNFPRIASAMKRAAKELNVPIEWGGDWVRVDGPHFQLPKGYV